MSSAAPATAEETDMALLATMPMAAVQLPSVAPGLPRQPIGGSPAAEPEPGRDPSGAPNADSGNGAGKPQLFSSPLTPMRLAAVSADPENPESVPDAAPDTDDAPPKFDPMADDEPADADDVIAATPVADVTSNSAPYEIPDLFADEATEAMPAVADATPDAIPAEAASPADAATDEAADEAPGMALAEAADEGVSEDEE